MTTPTRPPMAESSISRVQQLSIVNFAATVVERPRSPGRVAGGREAGK